MHFLEFDSYLPFDKEGRELLDGLRGNADFVLANPPSSEGDDGFGFRRVVLKGAREFLRDGGLVFLSISYQYGERRIRDLGEDVPGFQHREVLAITDWVPFDLGRKDLMDYLEAYFNEESRGGRPYEFRSNSVGSSQTATEALEEYRKTGKSPLSKWQTHLYEYRDPNGAS